jgi:hypothetical protein
MSKQIFSCLFITILLFSCTAQPNLAERLGYDKDTKMLIMHADDVGVAYSVNKATLEAFSDGAINSASIMVPCPWFKDIVASIQENPGYDFGLHLTITAEWDNFKWGGVLPSTEIPSLINSEGYFYASVEEVVANATPEDVEKEIRAQVQRAIDFGINPTHLDSHMGTLFNHPEYFKSYQKVGKEFGIPVFIPLSFISQLSELIDDYFIPVNQTYMAGPEIAADNWNVFYTEVIGNLEPGLSEIIVHLAYDDDEMSAVAVNHPDYGAAWRQRDLDYVMSDEFRSALKDNNIQLVTFGQLQKLMLEK